MSNRAAYVYIHVYVFTAAMHLCMNLCLYVRRGHTWGSGYVMVSPRQPSNPRKVSVQMRFKTRHFGLPSEFAGFLARASWVGLLIMMAPLSNISGGAFKGSVHGCPLEVAITRRVGGVQALY